MKFQPFCLVLAMTFIAATASTSARSAPQKPMVFAKDLKKTELADVISYPARVVSQVSAALFSEFDGRIIRITAPLGSSVAAGKSVVVVKNTDPVYEFAPAAITAPVTGVVSQLDISVGAQVTRGQKLGSITDPTKLSLALEIPAQDLALVSKGLAGELFLTHAKTQALPVKIRGVSALVDPTTGTASAEVDVLPSKDKSALLRPGLLGQVHFKVNRRQGFSVSEDSLVYRGTDSFLRLIEDKKAKLVAVNILRKSQGNAEIAPKQGDFSDKTVYVERASQFIADGDEVTIAEQGK